MSITEFAPVGLPALAAGRIAFFPTIANLAAPKVSEITLNLTYVPDAGWEPTFEQSAGSRMKYASDAEYEVPGKGKWTGQPMVYEVDPQDVTDASTPLQPCRRARSASSAIPLAWTRTLRSLPLRS